MRLLLAAIVLVLLAIVVYFVFHAGTQAPIVAYVTAIDYSPPGAARGPPYLSYVLTPSLSVTPDLQSRTAILKTFTPAAGSNADTSGLIPLLLRGLPFAPTWSLTSSVPTVTSNTLPLGAPTKAISVTGLGEMWFV